MKLYYLHRLPCGHAARHQADPGLAGFWCLQCEHEADHAEEAWERYEYAGAHVRDLMDDDEIS